VGVLARAAEAGVLARAGVVGGLVIGFLAAALDATD